jgi:hypothetical protein
VVRAAHPGLENVLQRFASWSRFGKTGGAAAVNQQFKCVHLLTPVIQFAHEINTGTDFVTAFAAIPADKAPLCI